MGAFRFAHQLLRGGSVSGTVDATYESAWLIDGSPGKPVQTSGNLSLSVTPPATQTLDLFAIINHTVNVSTILSSGVSATIPAADVDAEGIRYNSFVLISPTSVSSAFNVSVSSNGEPVVIGELYGGLSTELAAYELDLDPGEPFPWESEFSSIPPYDPGLSHPRRLSGEVMMTRDQFELIKLWYAATRRGTRPSIVIPDDEVNDVWCVLFQYRMHYEAGIYYVTLEMVEIPRTRW